MSLQPASGPIPGRKTGAARISIASNTTLIVLKIVAGVLTGSVAIITEAVHSSIDLVASIVAFLSVRKAEEPADESHPYGHEKVENLAAAFEGVLIVLGAGIIIYEAIRRFSSPSIERVGVGIAVIGLSMVVNVAVSRYLSRQARATSSDALAADAAHLSTDALTSLGVLIALMLIAITGAKVLDPIIALIVACAIVFSGVRLVSRSSRVLVDEALPEDELASVAEAIGTSGASEVIGFHKLRARRAGSRRYVDLHVQFRRGTSLERAHQVSHELQAAIRGRLRDADVLIHLEPEDAAQPRESGDARALSGR